MSTRALRRAQKELEERQQLEKLAHEEEEEEEESENEVTPASKPKPSLFAMLGDAGDEDEDEDEDERDGNDEAEGDESLKPEDTRPAPTPPQPSKKSKKKKKKKKGKGKEKASETPQTASNIDSDMDEIDRALLALNLTSKAPPGKDSDQVNSAISEESQQLYNVLAIDTQYLQAANEMRKLFGRAAVQANDDEPRPRQRGRGQEHGLAAAVAGRNAPGNRNLTSLALRRNIFIQGKEEWPQATSGGLGMEVVEKRSDGTVEYRFVHHRTYQDVQKQFEACVASMDPERMVQLLHFNPYHISTLLQVSEIAKQQRDNATAGDLLERALFSFGRAVHSTFANNLSQGKARLDFRRPENREFWLAAWRYISTLGIRATWRTAFEWAKLILGVAPEQDPYCIRLLIDQLALRGREPQALVDLAESDRLQRAWKIPPNLAMSVALAYDRLKNPAKARSSLKLAIKEYPWITARLCKELDISPIPKPIWGKEPNSDYQELLCQLYVPKAKDLWNTPEAISLLVEVAYSFEEPLGTGEDPYWLQQIDEIDLARHVILSDDQSLLTLIDQQIKAKYSSVSDPLPPKDDISSYNLANGPSANELAARLRVELEDLISYFAHVNLGRHLNAEITQEDLLRVLGEANTSLHEFRTNRQRILRVREQLEHMGIQVIVRDQDEPDSDSETE